MVSSPTELEYIQYHCNKSQLSFTRYFFEKRFNRAFVVGEHHVKISDVLDRVITGEIKRLIINIAPRYGKTELGVKNLIARGLGVNPSAKFIHLSYSDDLALDNSEEVKDLVCSEDYRMIYPNVNLKKDSRSKKKWYTDAGGGVYATSAAGQVTGFGAGKVDEEEENEEEIIKEWIEDIEQSYAVSEIDKIYKFGGALIIDDPIKPEDADSEIQRERVNTRYDSTISNRVNSRNTPIVIIMQRLHERDLCGYLIDSGDEDWHVLSMPSIKDDGTALWPFKHSIEELRIIEKRNPIVFERQHMQSPKPLKGLMFPLSELQLYNAKDIDLKKLSIFRCGVIDPAKGGGDDYAFLAGYLVKDKVYIEDVIYNNDPSDHNEIASIDFIKRNDLNKVTFEGNSAWYVLGESIRRKLQADKSNCSFRIGENTENKHTRILAQSSFIINHFVFRDDWDKLPQYNKFMRNLTSYLKVGGNAHDDGPDVAAELAKLFRKQYKSLW